MNDCAIKVENISKRYKIYRKPRDRIKEVLLFGKRSYHHDFWALKDVSFEVKMGETLGIIGQNGSGKSTLLQIIAGVLTPTAGSVTRNGRISSLLELGAGFNPEFTGRANVLMNGAFLGLTQKEMEKRMPEIEAFAEIGEYIDQPVKTYSSGMYVRLAFSAAINIDPSILIVDEALAVGDMRFQQKCYREIREIRNKGNTVLFVTHDTSAIVSFCTRVVWLEHGKIKAIGRPEEITKEYHAYMQYNAQQHQQSAPNVQKRCLRVDTPFGTGIEVETLENCAAFGAGNASLHYVGFYERELTNKVNTIRGGEKVIFLVVAKASASISMPGIGITLFDSHGNRIFTLNNFLYRSAIKPIEAGKTIFMTFYFTFPLLQIGKYVFAASISNGSLEDHTQLHWVHDAYMLSVASDDILNKIGCMLAMPRDSVEIKSVSE